MIKLTPRNFLLVFLSLNSIFSFSQNGFTTNNNELEELYDRYSIIYPQENLFTNVRPYNRHDLADIVYQQYEKDSSFKDNFLIPYLNNEFYDKCIFIKNTMQAKKKLKGIFYPNDAAFAAVYDKNFTLRLNPVLELKLGKESNNEQILYQVTRGAEIMGTIGGSIHFYTQFTENQMRPFQYITQYGNGFNGQNSYNFNPYYTYWKDIHNNQGYDFSNSIGYVEYNPGRYLSVMLGHDRNHYGYGYRSLFLGDNGAPYFQIKANAYIWKFHYHMMLAEFTGQYVRGGDRLLPKKYGAFHMLSYKPIPKLEIGLYEGIIFHRNNGFELNYLNPMIFYHSVEHAIGSPDNVFLGLQAKYNVNEFTQFYGQFLLDDMQVGQFFKGSGWWGNKYGIQLGSKFVNLFQLKNLDAQLEYNMVRPYTYSHYEARNTDTLDNFTHYNQPLAHPYGANFMEVFGRISYKPIPKLKMEAKFNYNKRGYDASGKLYGNNIFANTNGNIIPSEFNNELLQGEKITQQILSLGGQYSLFHNVFWDLDFIYRNTNVESTNTSKSTIGFMTGLRVNLRKRDYMF
jgi:hypothetical protein